MGLKKYLLDSNVIIDYLRNKLPVENLKSLYEPKEFLYYTSVICKIEIMGYQSILITFENEVEIMRN